jgi:hypothetical protein
MTHRSSADASADDRSWPGCNGRQQELLTHLPQLRPPSPLFALHDRLQHLSQVSLGQ